MKLIYISRIFGSDEQGTAGVMYTEGFSCYTLELPWKRNTKNISCIPEGVYKCSFKHSPKFGPVYQVEDVPGRTHILLHAGNWAGDTQRGFLSDVEGCILLGDNLGELKGQRALINSRKALNRFLAFANSEDFALCIIGPDYMLTSKG